MKTDRIEELKVSIAKDKQCYEKCFGQFSYLEVIIKKQAEIIRLLEEKKGGSDEL